MAARVNVKFVALLSIVLVGAMGGVVWMAMMVLMRSGDDHANRARQLQAEGDFTAAESSWSKAVNHDPSNLDWLAGWRSSLESIEHPTYSAYQQDYANLRNILRVTAEAKGADFDAQEEHLSGLMTWSLMRPSDIGFFEMLDSETNKIQNNYDWADSNDVDRLRRHRGQYGAQLILGGIDLDQDQIQRVREDLIAAIAADPTDIDSVERLNLIRFTERNTALNERRLTEAEAVIDDMLDELSAFISRNPGSIRARAMFTQLRLLREADQLQRLDLFGRDLSEAQERVVQQYASEVRSLLDEFLEAPADQTDTRTGQVLTQLIRQAIPPADRIDATIDVWNRAASNRPLDIQVLQTRAAELQFVRRYAEAIDALQDMAAIERPPLSADGMLVAAIQSQIGGRMANAALDQWRLLPAQAPSRDRWLEDARGYRITAAENTQADAPELTLIDAKLAYADGDFNAAERLIRRYNTQTNESDTNAIKLAADIASQLGNTGEQRRLLTIATNLNSGDFEAVLGLADISARLRDYEEAERLYQRAAEAFPNEERILDRLRTIQALTGTNSSEDPVQQALVEAQQAIERGARLEAAAILERAIEANAPVSDGRLHISLASMLLRLGEFDRATAVADAGLAIEPESASLAQIRRQASIGGDADLAITAIDGLNISESQKAYRTHLVHLSTGDIEAATTTIDRALELAPDDTQILLAAFDHAIRVDDLDSARAIIAEHGERDIDGAGGLALQARLLLAEDRLEDAERTLIAATERGSQNPRTLRLLAQIQLRLGKNTSAIDTFSQALAIRPDDVELITDYLRALFSLGRTTDALRVARDSLELGRSDEQFTQMWLALEGAAGNKRLAYEERQRIAEARPEFRENVAAMIDLAIDLSEFDAARAAIDTARAEDDSLELVALDAKWYANRNQLARGVEQFTGYLVSDEPDAISVRSYLTFGSFLIERGMPDRALTTLRQGRTLQDPSNPVIDTVLGREFLRLGRYDEAIELYEALLRGPAADGPAGREALPRLIEAYTRIGTYDKADERITQLDAETRDQLVIRLLRSEVAQGLGNTAEARRIIDEAIAAFPDAPMPYVQRATMLARDRTFLEDALEDLGRAIELDPTNLTAYRLRSSMLADMGRMDDAAQDVITAIAAYPENLEVRIGGARRLIEFGRDDAAADVIDAALEREAGNLQLLVSAGDLFAEIDRARRASGYYERAWEQTKDLSIGIKYVQSLMAQPRPDVRRARQVTSDPALPSDDARVLLVRASVESEAENRPEVERLLMQAYELAKTDPTMINMWANRLIPLLEDREQALSFMNRIDRSSGLTPWAQYARARLLAIEADGIDDAYAALEPLIAGSPNPNLRLRSLKFRSVALYRDGDYVRAAEDMRRGLELVPDDADLLNNLAYTMAVHLGEASAALPFARRAAELYPNNRGYLDTLGLTLLRNGQHEEGLSTLERALPLATTDAERAPVLIHLAEARLETGNATGADNAAQEARAILSAQESPDEEQQDQLDRVLEMIRQRT
ncbi:MAG: tetratricopeptide repeat protein [Planctomycetota bacterium]